MFPVPQSLKYAEYGRIDPDEILKLVDEYGQIRVSGKLENLAEETFQCANLGGERIGKRPVELLYESFNEIRFTFPGHEQVDKTIPGKSAFDKFRLSDATSTCQDGELRCPAALGPNRPQSFKLRLPVKEFHPVKSSATAVSETAVSDICPLAIPPIKVILYNAAI